MDLIFGVYRCAKCWVYFTANRADTWDRCTPVTCHTCTEIAAKGPPLSPSPSPDGG